jgi:hypothetical protein
VRFLADESCDSAAVRALQAVLRFGCHLVQPEGASIMTVRLQLPRKWVDYLVHQPESGMGYQRVDVLLEDGTELQDCTVFNAEEIEIPYSHANKRIEGLKLFDAPRTPRTP